jgi:hypothetical protein
MAVDLRGPISKDKAKKKFTQGNFSDLVKHDNIYKVNQNAGGLDVSVICRVVPFTSEGNVEITPIGIILFSEDQVEGELKLKETTFRGADVVALQDFNEDGSLIKTVAVQINNGYMNSVLDMGAVKRQLSMQIR